MKKWLRSPWIMGIIVLLVGLIVAGYWFQWSWTGFPTKTLWDWFNLLGVFAIPVVVGFGTVWFTTKQGQVSIEENTDNQRETALQTYIDNMSELLLHDKLRNSVEGDEVMQIARIRTLTVLRRLDASRKGNVIQFLRDARLIDKSKTIVNLQTADLIGTNLIGANLPSTNLSQVLLVDANLSFAKLGGANLRTSLLQGADLSFSYLKEADLSGADLSRADLSTANLSFADFSGTTLKGANFKNANLKEANFSYADLKEAIVSAEQLGKTKLMQGATMPDGSIHP